MEHLRSLVKHGCCILRQGDFTVFYIYDSFIEAVNSCYLRVISKVKEKD
jgi:hypothetical protein